MESSGGTDGGLQQQRALAAAELVSLDGETLDHYENCFWATVDPALQILHPASNRGASRELFLDDTIHALGSQVSERQDAKRHSRAFAERAAVSHRQVSEQCINLCRN